MTSQALSNKPESEYRADHKELKTQTKYANQFQLGLGVSSPFDKTAEHFETGELTAQLEYSAYLRDNWLLGFGGGYQNLNNKKTGRSLAIAKLFQRSRKLYRLYHPLYFALGFEFSYLYPAASQDILPSLEDSFAPEIGTGISNSFILRFSGRSAASLNINVWRGVNSRELQAIDFSIMVGQSI